MKKCLFDVFAFEKLFQTWVGETNVWINVLEYFVRLIIPERTFRFDINHAVFDSTIAIFDLRNFITHQEHRVSLFEDLSVPILRGSRNVIVPSTHLQVVSQYCFAVDFISQSYSGIPNSE